MWPCEYVIQFLSHATDSSTNTADAGMDDDGGGGVISDKMVVLASVYPKTHLETAFFLSFRQT